MKARRVFFNEVNGIVNMLNNSLLILDNDKVFAGESSMFLQIEKELYEIPYDLDEESIQNELDVELGLYIRKVSVNGRAVLTEAELLSVESKVKKAVSSQSIRSTKVCTHMCKLKDCLSMTRAMERLSPKSLKRNRKSYWVKIQLIGDVFISELINGEYMNLEQNARTNQITRLLKLATILLNKDYSKVIWFIRMERNHFIGALVATYKEDTAMEGAIKLLQERMDLI